MVTISDGTEMRVTEFKLLGLVREDNWTSVVDGDGPTTLDCVVWTTKSERLSILM